MLQEYGVTGDFADVDGDREALGGEDGVHDGDVLRGEVAADAEDEDAGGSGGRGEVVCGCGCWGMGVAGGGGGEGSGVFVDVG